MTDTTPAPSNNGIRHTACGESTPPTATGALFDRVATIIDQARAGVVRAVNSRMVIAYWLIGREIIQELQGGDARAEYGDSLIAELSKRLTTTYGSGFSLSNLKDFRLFYTVFSDRVDRLERALDLGPVGALPEKSHALRGQSDLEKKSRALRGEFSGFHPSLSWTHYRALMRVENPDAREFYENEAVAAGWSTRELERQMDSYVRMYEDLYRVPGDNPTVGLILCSEKNETIARYSVLADARQLFASKYRLHLPTEKELAAERKREILALRKGGRG